MFWLRPILLLAGALFIGVLFWWERRRSRQAAGVPSARTARAEPSFESMPITAAGNEREQRRALPVIDWSTEALSAGSGADAGTTAAGTAAAVAVPAGIRPGIERDIEPEVAPRIEPVSATAQRVVGVARDAAVPVVVTVAELPPMIVDWPDEQVRRIVTLRIVPAGTDRLPGRAIRQALSACGFRHGEFGIFHLPDETGRVFLSAASLVLPGTLDPAAMDFQRFSGLNVFAVLPGPLSAEVALERLGQLAIELAGRLSARVHDDQSAPLGASNAGAWRRRIMAAQPGAAAATGVGDSSGTAAGAAAGPAD
jgi:ZipA, C-terminal FtsZ-binding domain